MTCHPEDHILEAYGSMSLTCDTCNQPATAFVADGPPGCTHIGSTWPCGHDGVAESVPITKLPDGGPISMSGGPGVLTASGGLCAPVSPSYDFGVVKDVTLNVKNDYAIFADDLVSDADAVTIKRMFESGTMTASTAHGMLGFR